MHVSDSKEEGEKVTRWTNKGNVDILLIREGEAAISVPLREDWSLGAPSVRVYMESREEKRTKKGLWDRDGGCGGGAGGGCGVVDAF